MKADSSTNQEGVESAGDRPVCKFINAGYAANMISSCCVNRRNTKLALGLQSSDIDIWDQPEIPGSETLKSFPDKPEPLHLNFSTLTGHINAVNCVSFVPNKPFLLSSSNNSAVQLWNAEKRTMLTSFKDDSPKICDISVQAEVKYFVTACSDGTTKIWSFERNYPVRTLTGHSSDVLCTTIHPNSLYVATGSSDKTIRVWSVKDSTATRLFKGHNSPISCVQFAPNCHHLVSADCSGVIKIWDLQAIRELCSFRAHSEKVTSLSYNSSSSLLATGCTDTYLKIWSMESYKINDNTDEDKNSNADNPKLVYSHYTGCNIHLVHFGPEHLTVVANSPKNYSSSI